MGRLFLQVTAASLAVFGTNDLLVQREQLEQTDREWWWQTKEISQKKRDVKVQGLESEHLAEVS